MTSLFASLILASPWMAAGAALAALPIAAHLLHRHVRKRVVFPTIRLLQESKASTSQLFQLRRLLILLIRCAVIVLVALAFARPVWFRAAAPSAAPTEDGVAVVLVVDGSASMNAQSEGRPLLETARALGDRTLNSLDPGRDRVGLLLASARPEAALPELTADLETIRRELRALKGTQQRADFQTALARAAKLLRQHPGPHRLVIFSDMQRLNWADVAMSSDGGQGLPKGTTVTVVPVGREDCDNVALSRPRCLPARPRANAPVKLSVQVTNYSPKDKDVNLQVSVDGRAAGSRTLKLAPWVGVEEVVDVASLSAGTHEVVFSVGRDQLPADDDVCLSVQTTPRLRVAVVSDDNPNEQGTSSYFLTRALSPRGDLGDEFDAFQVESASLDLARIADTDAVFVAEVGKLSREALEALLSYVERGGGVAVFCGPGPVAANLTALDGLDSHADVLPWKPLAARNLAPLGGFLCLGGKVWDPVVLPGFDADSREALCQMRFFGAYQTSPLNPSAREVLRYSDGTIAVACCPVGEGKLMLINAGCSLRSSDMGKHGGFVAMAHALANYLRPVHTGRSAAVAGASLSIPLRGEFDEHSKPVLIGPDGEPCETETLFDGTLRLVHLSLAPMPGFYHVQRDGRTVDSAAVNVHPSESDLRRMPPEELNGRLVGAEKLLTVQSAESVAEIVELRGKPMWHVALLLALGLVAAELGILCFWKR